VRVCAIVLPIEGNRPNDGRGDDLGCRRDPNGRPGSEYPVVIPSALIIQPPAEHAFGINRACTADRSSPERRRRHVVLAGYHRWPGEVLEQSACDDPGMDEIMISGGLLYPYDQKASPRGLREATATGNRSR
jgi:hypothetical protein